MFMSLSVNRGCSIAVALVGLVPLLCFIVPADVDAALHQCTNGQITLIDQQLGRATFDETASSCVINISDGSAMSLIFSRPVTNLVLDVRHVSNLTALQFSQPATNLTLILRNLTTAVATTSGGFIFFLGSFNGGSIDVQDIVRNINSTVAGGYQVLNFGGLVTGMSSVSVKRIVVAANISADGSSGVSLTIVYFAFAVRGNEAARCVFNVSEITIVAGSRVVSTATSRTPIASFTLLHLQNAITGFTVIEVSRNSMSNVTVSGPAAAQFTLLDTGATASELIITGRPESRIALRNNDLSYVTVTAGAMPAELILWKGPPATSVFGVYNVSTIIIDGADMRGISVSSNRSYIRIRALFVLSATFSLVHAGRLEMRNVFVGGSALSAGTLTHDGVKLLDLISTRVRGVQEIIVSDCRFESLNFTASTTSGSAHVRGNFLHVHAALDAPVINVNNNRIEGATVFQTNSGYGFVMIAIARFEFGVTGVQLLSAKHNSISSLTATATGSQGAVEVYNLRPVGNVTASAGSLLDVSGTIIRGTLTSPIGWVCAGVVQVNRNRALSGFDAVNSEGSSVIVQSEATAVYVGGDGAGSVMVKCGDMTSITATAATSSPVRSTTTATTTAATTLATPPPPASTTTTASTVSSETFSAAGTASSSSTTTLSKNSTSSAESLTIASTDTVASIMSATSATTMSAAATTTPVTSTTAMTTSATSPSGAATTASTPVPTPPLSRTKTASHTLSENPEPAPVRKEQPVAAASRAAATFFSMLAPAAAATSMRALTAASSLVGCGAMVDAAEERREAIVAVNTKKSGRSQAIAESERDEGNALPALGWDSNLLLIDTGSGDESKLGTYVGGVISSIVVTVAVLLAGYFVAWVRSISSGASFSTGCRKTHVPGILGISSGVVIAPCAYASVVLLLHPRGSNVVGGIGVTWCALSLLVYAYLAQYFGNPDNGEVLLPEPKDDNKQDERNKKNKSGSNNNSNNKNSKKKKRSEQEQEETTVGKPLGLFEFLFAAITFMTEPRREYKKSYGSGIWLPMIDAWIYPWFGALDLGVAIIVSAMAGVADGACSSRACCTTVSAISSVSTSSYLVPFLLLKPALVRFDQYNIPAVTTLSAIVSAIAIVASRGAGNDSTEAVITVVAEAIWYCGLVSLLLSSLANVLPSIIFFANLIQKRCCPHYRSESRTEEGFAARLAQLAARREDQQSRRQGLDPAAARASAAMQRCDDDFDAPLIVTTMTTTTMTAPLRGASANLSHFSDHLNAAMPIRPLRNRYPAPPVPAAAAAAPPHPPLPQQQERVPPRASENVAPALHAPALTIPAAESAPATSAATLPSSPARQHNNPGRPGSYRRSRNLDGTKDDNGGDAQEMVARNSPQQPKRNQERVSAQEREHLQRGHAQQLRSTTPEQTAHHGAASATSGGAVRQNAAHSGKRASPSNDPTRSTSAVKRNT